MTAIAKQLIKAQTVTASNTPTKRPTSTTSPCQSNTARERGEDRKRLIGTRETKGRAANALLHEEKRRREAREVPIITSCIRFIPLIEPLSPYALYHIYATVQY